MNVKTTAMVALLVAAAACKAPAAQNDYTVTATLTEDEDGATAYIINYDNSSKLDSTVVDNGVAHFKGVIDKPVLARLIVGGDRMGTFILEPGNITLAERHAGGSPLNARMDSLDRASQAIVAEYQRLAQDTIDHTEQMADLQKRYNDLFDRVGAENLDNPIGYYLFLQQAYEMDLAELKQAIATTPSLGEYHRVQKLLKAAESKAATSAGAKFVDFTIEQPDSTSKSLSDYVGKGDYVLVDFWASWCGPCIRETQVIKEILAEHGDKLKVLGVAVWDEVPNTKAAIERYQLPWEQILGAKEVPTDLYGISGIPCIILFSPDGTILFRDLQDQELKAAVAAELAK